MVRGINKRNTGFELKHIENYTYISNITEDMYTLIKNGPDKLFKDI